jgi:hypothetical protein
MFIFQYVSYITLLEHIIRDIQNLKVTLYFQAGQSCLSANPSKANFLQPPNPPNPIHPPRPIRHQTSHAHLAKPLLLSHNSLQYTARNIQILNPTIQLQKGYELGEVVIVLFGD